MKYKVFELIGKSRYEPDGHCQMKTVTTYKLEDVEEYQDFDSIESAEKYIENIKDKYKGQALVILPIYQVKYNGEVA